MYLYPPSVEPVIRRLLDERGANRAPTFVDDLSTRELEVLRCLIAGMTRAEVAQRLFISPNTVRTHVQHLLSRARVHSTVALVAAARSAGVGSVDDPRLSTGARNNPSAKHRGNSG
jgi:two-component system nitrate/nitrite response regulator NarL